MPSLTLQLPHPRKDDKSKKIMESLRARVRYSEMKYNNLHEEWRKAHKATLAYLPERETDAKRRAARENEGLPQYTTLQIPYSYAVLSASHTYWANVFLGRDPVYQFTGRHGETQQQVQAVEALQAYQTRVGMHLPPLYSWLYDAGKFGVGILGAYWETRIERITSIEEVPLTLPTGIALGGTEKRRITREGTTYQGNRVYNVEPFNFLPDPRVPIKEFQRGEFCATRTDLSWNEVLRRQRQGLYMEKVSEWLKAPRNNFIADESGASEIRERPSEDEQRLLDELKKLNGGHPQLVPIYEVYVELIPKEWGLGNSDFPEKWVFTITQDYDTFLGAQPMGAYHAKYPFQVLEMEPESYSLVNRGIPKILESLQETMDWLLNSHFYNVRAALNNQFIVDPSKVVMADLLDPLPGNIIRAKPGHYGDDIRTAIHQLNVNDVTQNNVRDLQMMFGIGERVMGVSDQILGALSQGGRKTATEVRTSSTFGVNRLKTISEYFSAVGFEPLGQMLVQNTQQYYDAEMKLRIAGNNISFYQPAADQIINVTPESIMGFYDLVPVDGTLPVDRFAQANLWKELFAQMRNFPQLMMQYDMGKIFEHVAMLSGLKNVGQFRIQVMPDAALAAQAQQGNVVPIAPGAREGRQDLSRAITPPQVPNLGPSG